MNPTLPANAEEEARRRRVALAQQAYRDFFAQCFWSYREDAEITEDKIPLVIRGLRENSGQPAPGQLCGRGHRAAPIR